MKGRTLIFFGIIAAVIGLALIIFRQHITSKGVVVAGGLLFMIIGLANLLIFGQRKDQNGVSRVFTQVTNAAAIVLGICMLVFQSTFVPLVTFIFGLLVAVCALWQFFVLAIGARPHQLPGWLYIFPIAIAAVSAFIFIYKTTTDSEIMLASGIAFAILGAGCIVEGIPLGMARRRTLKEAQAETQTQIKDQKQTEVVHEPAGEPKETEDEKMETMEDIDDGSDKIA